MMWHSILAADTTSSFWLPVRASEAASNIDWLFNVILWVNIFFSVLIFVLMFLFVIRYRHRPGNEEGAVGGHNNALEITWTVIPTIIVVFIYYWGFKGFLHQAVEPPAAYEIKATGRMWSWQFDYPNGASDNELHVPPNVPVRVTLKSDDVIHDLYVPAFRVKKDAVPGRFNRLWFTAILPGTYDLYCALYCGTNHSTMHSVAVVHNNQSEFEQWLAQISDPRDGKRTYADIGKMLYEKKGCISCHSINGTKVVGPTWQDMWGNNIPLEGGMTVKGDEAYVRESILQPSAKIHQGFASAGGLSAMPPFALKDYEVESIMGFMKSISSHATAEEKQAAAMPVPKPEKK